MIGTIVLYRVSQIEVRPAIVVREWSPECLNLRVLLDGNDIEWRTSVTKGDDVGQWSEGPPLRVGLDVDSLRDLVQVIVGEMLRGEDLVEPATVLQPAALPDHECG